MGDEPESELRCLLCGAVLQDILEAPLLDSPEELVCRRHDDETLANAGLLGGQERVLSRSEFGTVVGAWELLHGGLGLYVLLDTGDLLSVTDGGLGEVVLSLVPAKYRASLWPGGVAKASTPPWPEAIARRWRIHSIEPWSDVSPPYKPGVRLSVGPGALLIKPYPATWPEMGSYRYFLGSEWCP